MRGTTLHLRKPLVGTNLISRDAVIPWRPNKCIWLGQNYEAAHWQIQTGRMSAISDISQTTTLYFCRLLNWWRCKGTERCLSVPSKWANGQWERQQPKRYEITHHLKKVAHNVTLNNQMLKRPLYLQDKVLVPRSSSPVTVYVELPCVIEQGEHQ